MSGKQRNAAPKFYLFPRDGLLSLFERLEVIFPSLANGTFSVTSEVKRCSRSESHKQSLLRESQSDLTIELTVPCRRFPSFFFFNSPAISGRAKFTSLSGVREETNAS